MNQGRKIGRKNKRRATGTVGREELLEEELEQLGQALTPWESDDPLTRFHGFLVGLALVKNMVAPSSWLPAVMPNSPFRNPDHATVLLGILMRRYNQVQQGMLTKPLEQVPAADSGKQPKWCAGCIDALRLDWEPLEDSEELGQVIVSMMVLSGQVAYKELGLRTKEATWRAKIQSSLPRLVQMWMEDAHGARMIGARS